MKIAVIFLCLGLASFVDANEDGQSSQSILLPISISTPKPIPTAADENAGLTSYITNTVNCVRAVDEAEKCAGYDNCLKKGEHACKAWIDHLHKMVKYSKGDMKIILKIYEYTDAQITAIENKDYKGWLKRWGFHKLQGLGLRVMEAVCAHHNILLHSHLKTALSGQEWKHLSRHLSVLHRSLDLVNKNKSHKALAIHLAAAGGAPSGGSQHQTHPTQTEGGSPPQHPTQHTGGSQHQTQHTGGSQHQTHPPQTEGESPPQHPTQHTGGSQTTHQTQPEGGETTALKAAEVALQSVKEAIKKAEATKKEAKTKTKLVNTEIVALNTVTSPEQRKKAKEKIAEAGNEAEKASRAVAAAWSHVKKTFAAAQTAVVTATKAARSTEGKGKAQELTTAAKELSKKTATVHKECDEVTIAALEAAKQAKKATETDH